MGAVLKMPIRSPQLEIALVLVRLNYVSSLCRKRESGDRVNK